MPYTDEQRADAQRKMIAEGVFSRVMDGLTGGVILVGLALALGAGDLEIGILAAIPFLANLAHIPAVALLRRFPDHKRLVVWGSVASRVVLLGIGLMPILLRGGSIGLLLVLMIAYALLAMLAGAGWQVWVRQVVPRERLGAYFGRRMGVLSAVGLVTTVVAGGFVQAFPAGSTLGFSALFAAGAAFGLVSSTILARAPSVPSTRAPDGGFRAAMRQPYQDRNYRRLLVFLAAWGFAANLALPFVSVVLLRTLGYGVLLVTLLAALSQLANIAGFQLWAPLTDRFGNKPVLGLAASVFLFALALWTFTPKVAGPFVVASAALLHLLLGFATAGLDVAANGVVLKLAPEENAPGYLASASVVKALAAGVAPVLGGLGAMALAGREVRVQLAWTDPAGEGVVTALRFAQHDFLFLASLVVGLYALHRLLGFAEAGEVPAEVVVRAMRRELPLTGSIAGMRGFAHVASYVVEAAYRFERAIPVPGEPEDPPPERAQPT